MKRRLVSIIVLVFLGVLFGEEVGFSQRRPWYRRVKNLPRTERGMPRYKKPRTKLPTMQQVRQRFERLDWQGDNELYSPQAGEYRKQLVWDKQSLLPIYQLRMSLSREMEASRLKHALQTAEANGFNEDTSPEVLLHAVEQFYQKNGALPRFALPNTPVEKYTLPELRETQLRQRIYQVLSRVTAKEVEENEDLLHLQQFMIKHTSLKQVLHQLDSFHRKNGRMPRSAIPGKPTREYTVAEYFEVHLHEALNTFLQRASDEPQDLSSEKLQQLQNLSRAQMQLLSYGRIPWNVTHAQVNSEPGAWDLIVDFPEWLTRNQGYFVGMLGTNKALDAIHAAMNNGTVDDAMYQVIARLSQMKLGPQEDGTLAYVTFRGRDPAFPQAQDFHRILKIHGLPVEQVKAALALPRKNITFVEQNGLVTGLRLYPGVTAQEIETVVGAMVPEGFEVRMGAHEFEIRNDKTQVDFERGNLHLHIEKIPPTGEGEPDIGYALDLKASRLVKNKKPHQILRIYRTLFGTYMDDYMRSFTLSGPEPMF